MRRAKKLLVTGAAGTLVSLIRPGLGEVAESVRLSDIADLGEAAPHEELVPCDVTDADAVRALVRGCDVILHFGGISKENTAEAIHRVNIGGTYNVYEAARKEGARRVLFASSNHAVGFHTRETRLVASSPVRPDSNYGVSKVYGEALASLYWDKYGIESLSVRIGSCFERPHDRRMMATWMSPGDMLRLIARMIDVPRLGHAIVYGVSRNPEQWWDNRETAFLGWEPEDTTERFGGLHDDEPQDPTDPAVRYVGGGFARAGHFED